VKKQVSICFHASDPEIAKIQALSMKDDMEKFDVTFRIRGDTHPEAYPSFSELVNTAINDSVHDTVILVNDKVIPKKGDLLRMLDLLQAGFGYVGLYSVGFCALTKGLIREIGWFDERYLGGGYEDDDFLLRMKLHDIAVFDSHECEYDYVTVRSKQSVTVPLSGSEPHFQAKWKFDNATVKRVISEETYHKYSLPESNHNTWLPWRASVLGYYYGVGPKKGIPWGASVTGYQGHSRAFRFCTVPYAGSIVGSNREVIDESK
jgi:hypothetical protein